MLKLENTTFTYGSRNTPAINNITLEIKPSTFTGIIGATGSGKTTFCLLTNGLIPHSITGTLEGSVHVNDLNVKKSSVSVLAQVTGLVFQDPASQISSTKVISELAFGLENIGTKRNEMIYRIQELVSNLGIQHLIERDTTSLSGGELQLVVLGSVLIMKPKILVLDEPTAMLDPISEMRILSVITEYCNEGGTVLLASHDLNLIGTLTENIIALKNGNLITHSGTEEYLLNRINTETLRLKKSTIANFSTQLVEENTQFKETTKYEYLVTMIGELIDG